MAVALPNTSGLERIELNRISLNSTNVMVMGVIIAKIRPKKFADRSGDESKERAVWNFTIRDSPTCYINVVCWGFKRGIFELNDKYYIGDVVEIHQPQVELRRMHDSKENFRPKVTSPYTLIVSENAEAKIIRYAGNCHPYYRLLHFPTKPMACAYTLADVHNQKEKIIGVDILGLMRSKGRIRNITTREGIEQQVREIIILDQTSPGLRISIWEPDLIVSAGNWQILNTVLFITDIRCDWSTYNRSMVGALTSRSVLTIDPVGVEADNLRKYARETPMLPFAEFDQTAELIPNPSAIQNVMNVQQVLDKIQSIMTSANPAAEEQQFTALVYVVVTQLDLDGLSRITTTRCSRCNTIIFPPLKKCANFECAVGSGQEISEPVTNFDLRLMLTDQTGSLVNSRLGGQTAQMVLNSTVTEFLGFSDEEKSNLKWKLLMERCAVRILVTCAGVPTPTITILSCELASALEVANRLHHS